MCHGSTHGPRVLSAKLIIVEAISDEKCALESRFNLTFPRREQFEALKSRDLALAISSQNV
jgi:hypothetical protein